jgi:hypothetical protein
MITDWLKIAVLSISVGMLIAVVFWLMEYNYNDCMKVGHTNLYCLMHLR